MDGEGAMIESNPRCGVGKISDFAGRNGLARFDGKVHGGLGA